jgi:hypothetical protein
LVEDFPVSNFLLSPHITPSPATPKLGENKDNILLSNRENGVLFFIFTIQLLIVPTKLNHGSELVLFRNNFPASICNE